MSEAERQLALRAGALTVTIMVEVDHPDGMVYAWPGYGPLDYGGNTYEGLGFLGGVSGIKSLTELRIVELGFAVSGVDQDQLDGLSSSVKRRTGQVYEAWLTPDHVVSSRRLIAEGQLDYQTYNIGADGKATVRIVANAGMFHLLKRSNARWSSEEAKAVFPDEVGFDEMHLQQDAQLNWQAS